MQSRLKPPDPRFALILDDAQLLFIDRLINQEKAATQTELEDEDDSDTCQFLRARVLLCGKILEKIDSMIDEAPFKRRFA